MRAGQLDRVIKIQTFTSAVNDYGTPTQTWADTFTVRAQLISSTTEEFQRAYGEGANTAVVFRIRWLDGVAVDQRVAYGSKNFNIRDIKEIGRRNGLELRCEEVRE